MSSYMEDKIQKLFKRFAQGSYVNFSNKRRVAEKVWEYPIEMDDFVDFSNLQRIFDTYGSGNLYTASITQNKYDGTYLTVRYNK